MGMMRFDLGLDEMAENHAQLEHAFLTNYDGAAFPGRVQIQGQELQYIRQCSDSGKLNIPWPVEGFGNPVLRTCSVLERETPYVLAVELARGQLCEMREQHATWAQAGMLIPDQYDTLQKQAYNDFLSACFSQQNPAQATLLANTALQKICLAEDVLANSYIEQRMHVRRQRISHLPAMFGCDLGPVSVSEIPENYCDAFSAAGISLDWKAIESAEGEYEWERYDQQVEWAINNKLLLKGGPLLSFEDNGLPDWLANWKHDILNLQSFLSDYVETAVSRYTGKIRIWEVAARMNTGGLFGYTEENILAMTARMIDVARQVDEEGQIFIRVDRPWGDYQAKGKHRLTPWHVVDALLRSGTGLSGINLELAIGYEPGRNDARRLLRFSKLLDTWGSFGVPLHVTLACPSASEKDPLALLKTKVDNQQWQNEWTEQTQCDWMEKFLPMLLAKQPVAGIFWSHLSDSHQHRFPHAGLMKDSESPKLVIDQIISHSRAE